MFAFDDRSHHHVEDFHDGPLLQMGQPSERMLQRQQTDLLPAYRGDSHGLERELQFADLEYRVSQPMG